MGIFFNSDHSKNNKGLKYYLSGRKDEGLKLLTEAASNGQPNALSTVIWLQLLEDKFDQAIESYEKLSPLVPAWIAAESRLTNRLLFFNKNAAAMTIEQYNYQLSNSKSNAAIAYFANNREEVALRLWEEAETDHNHLEARFYPIFISHKENPERLKEILLESFETEELEELIHDMSEVAAGDKGWFQRWAKEAMAALNAAAKPYEVDIESIRTKIKLSPDELMSAIYLNDQILDWFENNRIDLFNTEIIKYFKFYKISGLFNVEVAKIQISAELRYQCGEKNCIDADECNSCGKSKKNYAAIMSADQDGDYLAFELRKSSGDEIEGLLISFQPENFQSLATFQDGCIYLDCQKAIPVKVGTIETTEDSMLFVADDFAYIDGQDLIVGLNVKPGKYHVFAWIGFSWLSDLTPIIVTVFHDDLSDKFEPIKVDEGMPGVFKKCATDSLTGIVGARFDSNILGVAEQNEGITGNESWYDQVVINQGSTLEDILAERGVADPDREREVKIEVSILEGLRMRGMKTFSDDNFRRILSNYSELDESTRARINKNLAAKAGVILD
jgi:hypothetical protein